MIMYFCTDLLQTDRITFQLSDPFFYDISDTLNTILVLKPLFVKSLTLGLSLMSPIKRFGDRRRQAL